MTSGLCGKITAITGPVIIFFCIVLLLPLSSVHPAETLSVIITSNIEGRAPAEDMKDDDGFLLKLAQSILMEKRRGRAELYVDMGNAFYPGSLSRYSFGSVMMDFFESMACSATVISSRDLRIGIDNLEFVRTDRPTVLLSANLSKKEEPVFVPWFIHEKGGKKVAFLGLTSTGTLIDIAEEKTLGVGIADHVKILEKASVDLDSMGVKNIVVLSGLTTRQNMDILKRFTAVDLVISGGDNRGVVSGMTSHRIDIPDGRSIIMLPDRSAYYSLQLKIDERITVTSFRRNEVTEHKTTEQSYRVFLNRLALWQKEYSQEGGKVIAHAGKAGIRVDDMRAADLLRDYYNAEVSIVKKDTMNNMLLKGDIRQFEINDLTSDEFPIFVYLLTGLQLNNAVNSVDDIVVSGYSGGVVQGYAVDPSRRYRIASTQTVYQRIRRALKTPLSYRNQWKSIPDLIEKDVRGRKALLLDEIGYLDRRFRVTLDATLSNFLEYLNVSADKEFSSPGGPVDSYRQWGLENNIVMNIYNRYHRFIINPYMHYIEMRQEDETINETETFLVKNLLRGIFEYRLNYFTYVNPYHKSQIDTVVKRDENGMRPAFIREIAGASFIYKTFEGKLGAGFERKIHDPLEDPVYGFETFLSWRFDFLKYFTYSIKFDSFISKAREESQGQNSYVRSELMNSLSMKLNSYLGISVKHKWYYYYSDLEDLSYSYRQFITSLDLKTDFKLY